VYDDVINDPLIELLNYYIENNRLIVEINRRGNYLPARIAAQDQIVAIILPPGDKNFPVIANKKPDDDSAAFPALHPVSFDAVLNGSLKTPTYFSITIPYHFSETYRRRHRKT